MRTIFKTLRYLILGIFLSPLVYSQPPVGKTGFIRLSNAVATGTGPLELLVDDVSINSAGYKLGDVTGGVAVKPGSHEITIRREGNKEGKTKVNVTTDETTIFIPFSEKVPASDTEPAHWEIRVLRLKQQAPESERSATFVSVSQNPEIKVEIRDPEGKWTPVFVKRLAIAQAPILYQRGYVPIKMGTVDLVPIPISDTGNYVVLLYDTPEGETKSLNFRDQRFLSAD